MAQLRAYDSIDMSYEGASIAEIVYADEEFLVLESGDGLGETYYVGRFTYPNGVWKGTVEGVASYYDDDLWYEIYDLALLTKYLTADVPDDVTYARAFAAADDFIGSRSDDYLIAYAGEDRIWGDRGDDTLEGMSGRDKLYGGSGRDVLRGGANGDTIYGGSGGDAIRGGAQNDRLFGGGGRDTFVFYDDDGADRIGDFEPGRDVIRILAGADEYADLRIARSGDDVKIAFADTVIFVEDVTRSQIGAHDFDFD